MWDYFISTNQEKVTYFDDEGNVNYYIDDLNILTINFNARFIGNSSYTDIEIFSYDKNDEPFKIDFGKKNRKKQYDGTSTYIINVTNINCNRFIYSTKSEKYEKIIFNYFRFELLVYLIMYLIKMRF